MKNRWVLISLLVAVATSLAGCTTIEKAKRTDKLSYELSALQKKMEKLKSEKEAKANEVSDLERAKLELEKRLQSEIENYKAKLKITEKGLVVTFLSEIFFNSGKDKIKVEGENALEQVAQVLNINIPDVTVAIEGHTDNDPIRYSGWQSNWELSSARALAVVHYFIDQCSISPERLSAVGYGEYHPVESNETSEGMQQNRRVEIVILPSEINKIK